jgi:hypothetical protein
MKKTLRFKVFERDEFTCQYCGKKPPKVVLEVDHIYPKSKGGTDDILNLITACLDCNRGKRDTIIRNVKTKKEVQQAMDEAKEIELQLKKYYRYQRKKEEAKNEIIEELLFTWSELWNFTCTLNKSGRRTIINFIDFLTINEIKESMEIARERIDDEEQCFRYFCGIVHNKKRENNERLKQIADNFGK